MQNEHTLHFIIHINKIELGSFLSALCVFNVFIDYIISASLRLLGVSNDNLRLISFIIYGLLVVVSLILFNRLRIQSLLIPLLFLIAFAVAVHHHPEIMVKYGVYYKTFLHICLPVYFLYSNIYDFDSFSNKVVLLSKISGTFFCIIFFINTFVVQILNSSSYQTTSYAFLLPIFVILSVKRKSKAEWVLLVLMISFAVVAGGRASLFCLGVYFAIYFIKKGRKNIAYGVLTAILAILAYVFFDDLLRLIAKASKLFGVTGGIAYYLSIGNVLSDSNRSLILEESLASLSKQPWTGYGFLGDRFVISYPYPHNILVELMLQFGVAVAVAFLIWFVWRVVRIERKNDSINENRIALFKGLFYSTGFLILLFSNTYVNQPCFFALIALLGNPLFLSESSYKQTDVVMPSSLLEGNAV